MTCAEHAAALEHAARERQPLGPLERLDRRPGRQRPERDAARRVHVAQAALVVDQPGAHPRLARERQPAAALGPRGAAQDQRRRAEPEQRHAEHHRRRRVEVGAEAEAQAGEDPQRPGVVAGARREVRDHDVVEREREREHRARPRWPARAAAA